MNIRYTNAEFKEKNKIFLKLVFFGNLNNISIFQSVFTDPLKDTILNRVSGSSELLTRLWMFGMKKANIPIATNKGNHYKQRI